MEDFFTSVTDRWSAAREDYHRHVLPGTSPLHEHLARPYRGLTQQQGLAPGRARWIHATARCLTAAEESWS